MQAVDLVRWSLWASFPFNLVAAYALAWPSSVVGRLMGLPEQVDPIYAALCGSMIAGFGFVYAWLAIQPKLDQPLLWLGAIGKAGVFVLAFTLWLSQSGPGATVVVACGDLAFATLWFWWLLSRRGAKAI